MNGNQNRKKHITALAVFVLMLVGTYNALVINTHSDITSGEIRFVKRLDESYGVVTPGRIIANSVAWKKLPALPQLTKKTIKKYDSRNSKIQEESAPASILEELELSLVDVDNSKKWKKRLTPADFSGSLSTKDGIIETLSVSLPNGEGINVSFTEMSGNVFEYDYNGELYSGLFYQIDENTYMVTLSNGPLESTRLRFTLLSVSEEIVQNNLELSEDHDVNAGSFGSKGSDYEAQPEFTAQSSQDLQSTSFNF